MSALRNPDDTSLINKVLYVTEGNNRIALSRQDIYNVLEPRFGPLTGVQNVSTHSGRAAFFITFSNTKSRNDALREFETGNLTLDGERIHWLISGMNPNQVHKYRPPIPSSDSSRSSFSRGSYEGVITREMNTHVPTGPRKPSLGRKTRANDTQASSTSTHQAVGTGNLEARISRPSSPTTPPRPSSVAESRRTSASSLPRRDSMSLLSASATEVSQNTEFYSLKLEVTNLKHRLDKANNTVSARDKELTTYRELLRESLDKFSLESDRRNDLQRENETLKLDLLSMEQMYRRERDIREATERLLSRGESSKSNTMMTLDRSLEEALPSRPVEGQVSDPPVPITTSPENALEDMSRERNLLRDQLEAVERETRSPFFTPSLLHAFLTLDRIGKEVSKPGSV